jgi:hypothetical protein
MSNTTTLAFTALCLAACATDPGVDPNVDDLEPNDAVPVEITPVVLSPQLDDAGLPIAGTLTIDTSKGRMDLTHLIPDEPRTFASWDEVHRWTAENLNAETVTDEEGHISSRLAVGYGQTVRYDTEANEMVPVANPISTMLGGTSGYIVVAGKQVCVDSTAACAPVRLEPAATGSSNGLSLTGVTGIFHTWGWSEVKTATSLNTSSRVLRYSCGFSTCYVYLSPVTLTASVYAYRSSGSISNGSRFEMATNSTAVAAALVGVGDTGLLGRTDSACGRSSGNDGAGQVNLQMLKGTFPQFGCP